MVADFERTVVRGLWLVAGLALVALVLLLMRCVG
jgi:hypothetical protein